MKKNNEEIKTEDNAEFVKEKSIPEKIDEIYSLIKPLEKGKKNRKLKEFKIPAKGKVSKSNAGKGFVSIMKIGENKNVSFEKQKIDMEVFKTNDGVYHASNGAEVYFWKGKPLLIQPAWRQNSFSPINTENNVYGQKPILAAMQAGVYTGEIKKKGGMKGIIWIIVIAVAGYLIYNLITKGKLA